ncbi:MAG: phosphoenolpyruvate--protein phosphotransferase [Planctomycetes bacterium]|nr:phosphoenolpyruvate--protein phosphotransferase [Planctomycetota bacterium]
MITKKGISASPGVAIGPTLVLDTEEFRIPRRTIDPSQVPAQIQTLDAALDASRQEVSELRLSAARKLGGKTATIFEFHEQFIADPKLRTNVVELIEQHRYTAAYSFAQVMNRWQRVFQTVADPYLKERVRDLFDIEKRVLRHILGSVREDISRLTESVVIVAHDLTPSQAVSLDRQHILGLAINVGGQTSHMAIIARMHGIPAVVALNDITSDVSGGETVIIDGTHGIVIANPDADAVERYRTQEREYHAFELELAGLRDLPAVTRDGVPVSLMANIEFAEETQAAMDAGAAGVGLYRSEFLFLSGPRLPTEEQQYEAFRTAARHAGGKTTIIRTMDLGADKMAESIGAPHDHNPVLGLRSLRYCLQHLDMFKTHLRAILRASVEGNVQIMFPMITTLMELRQAKATLADVMEDLEEEEIPFRRDLATGIMVETPAAALLSSAFAKEAAFFSIGTNDLTQYTLAVDRGNERVSHLYSPHNPAVLRLIRQVIRAARVGNIPVALCGEMAGAPIYTQLLLGLGLRALSMAPKDIPEIKKVIRSTTIARCEKIARRIMRFDADRQVLNYLRDNLRAIGPEFI